jgi:DNA (cytosine-5)-methyltransferase 1
MNKINHLDLFSGAGGFSLSLQQTIGEENIGWVGYSDIDKYANQVFKRRFPNAEELGSVIDINTDKLPRIDLITFGFPCQDISLAGKRGGLQANRSCLFFEAMRIIGATKPKYFIFENVKGLFSSNKGKDFDIILRTIAEFGYDGQWELCNTRWFLPQSRERIYFVGHIRGKPIPKVFPIGGKMQRTKQTFLDESMYRMEKRIRKYNGYSPTLNTAQGGGHIPLIRLDDINLIAKKRAYDTPKEINAYLKKYKVVTIKEISEKLKLPKTQVEHYFRSDSSRAIPSPEIWLQLKELLGFDDTYDKEVTEIYEKEYEFESSKRVYDSRGIAQTINCNTAGLYKTKSKIRRLTPTECERLQGFPDGWTEGVSDTQRYKLMGNAITVNVAQAIYEKLYGNKVINYLY